MHAFPTPLRADARFPTLPGRIARALLFAALLGLGACGGAHDAASHGTGNDAAGAALPKPEPGGGSVTGMPAHPGPGEVGAALAQGDPGMDTDVGLDANADPDVDADADPDVRIDPADAPGDQSPLQDVDTEVGAPPATPGIQPQPSIPANEPGPDEAMAVIRDYYSAIDGHDYANAYRLWSDGGRASGKTLQQFAEGFANTRQVSAQLQAPGRIDAGAGQRYIQITVTINALQRDGSMHRYAGTYTLHRTVVDGASAEQKAWRIGSAEIHQTSG